jgi:hypothetical protein
MNQLILFNGHSGDNPTATPHHPVPLGAGISSCRRCGAFVKEKVYDGRVLIREWQELDCRLDVFLVTKRAHIERLWACIITLYNYSFIATKR